MKRILLLIHKMDRTIYGLISACALVDALESFSMILLSSVLLKHLVAGKAIGDVLVLVVVLVAGYGVLNLMKNGLQQYREYRVDRLTYIYRQMVTEKVFSVPFENLERVEFNELLYTVRTNDTNYSLPSRTMEDVYEIAKSTFSILVAVVSFGELFGVVKHLGDAAFTVSLLLLGIFVLIVASTGYIAWRKKENAKIDQKLSEDLTKLNARSMAFAGMFDYAWGKHVRMDRMQPRLLKEWQRFEDNSNDWLKNSSRLERNVNLLAGTSSTLISGTVYLTVGIVALAGGLGVDSIIWYAGVVQRLLESIRSFIFGVGNLQDHCLRQLPIFELLEIAEEADVASTGVSGSLDLASHTIEFDDVSFAYPDTDRMILEHVNLRLSGQERIALVGRNGCGKSTLIKLICRLYDPTKGRILLDGVDIRTIPRQEYVKILSVVFQDFHIFADSLAGNIAMSDEVDFVRAAEMVERVGLGISDLDQPLLRHLEENGIEVSGGEGQKIAIARALYKDAPMVILDEPTAALDPLSESEIYEKFNLLVDGKMALFISHRLSSCRFCNRILVLQDGDIIQDGSHEELVAADGLYQQMWNAQKQYYV